MKDRHESIINEENIVELLSQLIEIESPYFEEEKIMKFAYKWCNKEGLNPEYHNYTVNKIIEYDGINVVGRLKGKKDGPKIYLNGHLDTVQLCEGWTRDPFKATIEGNKLYGVGALDMKSGSAAIMLALKAFKETVKDFNGEILYTLVSDEEGPYGLGTNALIEEGYTENVDVAIVPEPSSGFTGIEFPCLCLGARGGWNYTLDFTGKAAHAASPELGINAIADSSKVMLELEKAEGLEDDKLGKGSLAIISSEGGGAAASVADKAKFTVFRHTVRGEDKNYLIEEIKSAIDRADIKSNVDIKFREAPNEGAEAFLPYTVDENNIYTKEIKSSIEKISGRKPTINYFSSMGDFNYVGTRVNIPTFVFGPHGENYHSNDEYVFIDSVVKTAEVIYDFLISTLKAK
ncbi:M20/M25/M40 family metallo-hydrolase [Clostridium sp. D2Q-14]|uniref:M20 family metallopeptidase n=1 Tax=Anaeromonas gelatinilytica TaxID=2683194 RepID=UPI00193B70FC|nr:M20/M25/M40 family metallo-hydrolase [Anaeromonas gelatinilytica]MBS4536421.1 M20/M25/M40 family metallo-hydrolase [Anaeromonas gelatinilytica]